MLIGNPRQQHFLFSAKQDGKEHIGIESGFTHHFLFADPAVFGLIHENKRVLSQDIANAVDVACSTFAPGA